MDRRERVESRSEALLAALEGWQAGLWSALPAIIESFDPTAMTVTAQPAVQARVKSKDGAWTWMNLPLLLDVPVVFPGGGGWTLTFPVTAGDEALIVFASRCVDDWWQSGGVGVQMELRMHDLSDGFALVGLRSRPRVLPSINLTATQLRSDDGQNYVEVSEGGVVRVEADTVQLHARSHFQWDVNGFGFGVTYAGADVWDVHTWQTPRITDTVNSTATDIAPPEGGP